MASRPNFSFFSSSAPKKAGEKSKTEKAKDISELAPMAPLPTPGTKETKTKAPLGFLQGKEFPPDAPAASPKELFPNVKKFIKETRDTTPTPASADTKLNWGDHANKEAIEKGKESSMPQPLDFNGGQSLKQDASGTSVVIGCTDLAGTSNVEGQVKSKASASDSSTAATLGDF